jgi:hypothetical protein
MRTPSAYQHDSECAKIKDVSAEDAADWDDPKYKPKRCDCRARQEARKKAAMERIERVRTHSQPVGTLPNSSHIIGDGCYRTPKRRSLS